VSRRFDCSDAQDRSNGLDAAVSAVRAGALVVLPTDTVYGLGCDAFSADAVSALLAVKGRGRDMPVPVLVGSVLTLDAVATGLAEQARGLVDAFWPGALTLVCAQQPSLQWDLGDNRGTVAVRMPLQPVALELLARTGPMAVSSANRTGQAPATSCDAAREQLGDAVAVYLDGGPSGGPVPSSIVDVTGGVPRLLREGAVSLDALRAVVPELEPLS